MRSIFFILTLSILSIVSSMGQDEPYYIFEWQNNYVCESGGENIRFYDLILYDIPSFLMTIFFMVLTYVIVIPWLSKRKLKFRKRWIQMIDVFVFSWFLPLIIISVIGVFVYSVGKIDKIDNDVICCFAVSIYTIFLICFRFLYYKHIEDVAAKDDEEKKRRGFFGGSGSDIILSTHPGESRPQ